MTKLRSVRVVLHVGRAYPSWSAVLRTDDGRTVFDRRLHAGVIDHMGSLGGVTDVPTALRHIADEIDRRHGVPSAEPTREPLGAVGGGSTAEPEDLPGIDPVSPREQWVDVPLFED